MRATLAAFLFLASSSAQAVVLVADCKGFAWDYSAAQELLIDGFELILDGTPGARVDAAERGITCADAQLTEGDHTLAVRTFLLDQPCRYSWSFPVDQEENIDGFQVLIDGEPGPKFASNKRFAVCEEVGVVEGANLLSSRTYSEDPDGVSVTTGQTILVFDPANPERCDFVSANSNELEFTYRATAGALPIPSPVIMLSGVGGPRQNLALQFDGVDDFFDVGQPRVSGSAISITARVKAASFARPNHQGRIISQADGGVAERFHWWMISLNSAAFRYRLKTEGVTETLFSSEGTTALVAGQWHHVAATYDGANMKLYQDGQEVGSVAKTGPLDVADESIATYIGKNPGDTNSFKGLIDDVRIYSAALSPAQVAAVAAGDEVPDATLVANWDFEEGSPGDVAEGGPVYVEAD